MTDFPQLRLLSTNRCPCGVDAITTYGWCGECFARGLVPQSWLARITADLERINQ